MRRIFRRPSPSVCVAFVALVIAIGGVAFATIPDSEGVIHGCYKNVGGNLRLVESAANCRPSETAIAWNQQGPPGDTTNRVAFDEEAAEVSTQSNTYTELGGPTVQIEVPPSGLVAVFARADLRAQPAGPDGFASAAIFEETGIDPPVRVLSTVSGTYVRKWTTPGNAVSFGNEDEVGSSGTEIGRDDLAGWALFEVTPGTRTFSLRYRSAEHENDTAFFRNRKLWVLGIG